MKHLFFIPLLFIVVCCDSNESTSKANTDNTSSNNGSLVFDTIMTENTPLYLEVISKTEFDKVINKSALNSLTWNSGKEVIDDSFSVVRDSVDLIFKLRNGKSITFTDNKEGGDSDYRHYLYSKYIEELDSWGLNVGYMEDCEYILINKANGAIKERFGCDTEITFSPDKSFLIAYSHGNEMVGSAGHLAYYEINNKSLSLNWNWDLSVYTEDDIYQEYPEINGIISLIWENNNTIVFQREIDNGSKSKYNRLILK